MTVHPVGAELLHAYRQTDTTKLTVAFRNFEKAPKNRQSSWVQCCRLQLKQWHLFKGDSLDYDIYKL